MKKTIYLVILLLASQLYANGNLHNNIKTSFLPPPPTDVANDTLFLDVQNAIYSFTTAGNFLDIPIYIRSKGPVSSFDFRLKFNQTKLTYISTTKLVEKLEPFTSLNQNDNFLRNNTSGPSVSYVIPNNINLVYVRFQINVPCTTISETDFFSITTLLVGYPCKNQVTPVTPITTNTLLTTSPLSIGKSISFEGPSNTSGIPIVSYNWDLGNGETSPKQKVNTSYLEPGNYLVKLEITTKEGCKDTLTQLIQLKAASVVSSIELNSVKMYPNPTAGYLNIISSVNSNFIITDISGGKVIFVGDLNSNSQKVINVSNLSNGMYLVNVYNETFNIVERVVINN